MPRRNAGAALTAAAVTVLAVLLVAASGSGSRPTLVQPDDAVGWRGLVGGMTRQVPLGDRMLVVLNTPSLADRVAAAGGAASDDQERRWSAAAEASQQQLLFELVAKGVRATPDYRYTRVLNGFSAALDARAVGLLERSPQVRGVYPVRAAYPATVSRTLLREESARLGVRVGPPLEAGGLDGSGVTIALLDTGVDPASPFLHGHVLDGIDVLGDSAGARPGRRPGDAARLELHGTETAGILVGAGGPAGLAGVAPGASVLPIRIAGWQPDGQGSFAVYARTDQILAGLEKAVDPNGDGDAHDAARIALVPLAEPFGAFPDGPLARAVRGAARLDTLVVAAAGNDGPAGPVFGSIGAPGGSPDALTVGAADLRPRVADVPIVVRDGLRVLLRRRAALAGAVSPGRRLTLELADASRGAPLFDRNGYSLVAGKAALVQAGGAPREQARRVVAAGAAVVLVGADELPAGGLGLDEQLTAPVVAVPRSLEEQVARVAAAGRKVTVGIGPARTTSNAGASRVASFSSAGLAFGGGVKPDVVAPGVELATAEPGANPDGTSHFATVSGSSAAAAAAAGAAALVLQARPDLGAGELRSLLVGSARRLPSEALAAQGAGILDPGAASAAETATVPATLAFARGGRDGSAARSLLVSNVSTRRLTIYVGTARRSRPSVRVDVDPRRVVLDPGRSTRVRVRATVVGSTLGGVATGELVLAPVDGPAVHVPWALVLRSDAGALVGPIALTRAAFRPSESAPSVLTVRIGSVRLVPGEGSAVQPVERLDVELRSPSGAFVGLLARLRDVLPGRYSFGLTGHDPAGKPLPPGLYGVRLVAWPTGGGRPGVRQVTFRIE